MNKPECQRLERGVQPRALGKTFLAVGEKAILSLRPFSVQAQNRESLILDYNSFFLFFFFFKLFIFIYIYIANVCPERLFLAHNILYAHTCTQHPHTRVY